MDCRLPSSSDHGDSPGKNTGVGCHALFQGIFPTRGLNPGLPHCRRIPCCLRDQGRKRLRDYCVWKFPLEHIRYKEGAPGGSCGKQSTCNAGDLALILESGRSPGERNGYLLQSSCLENSMDRQAWWTKSMGVTKNWTRLSVNTYPPPQHPHTNTRSWLWPTWNWHSVRSRKQQPTLVFLPGKFHERRNLVGYSS